MLRIDAPVVVNPEAVSKKASVKEPIDPVNKNGSVQKIDINSHPKETIANPSFASMSPFSFADLKITSPDKIVIAKERNKPNESSSPWTNANRRGKNIEIPRKNISKPSIRITDCILI